MGWLLMQDRSGKPPEAALSREPVLEARPAKPGQQKTGQGSSASEAPLVNRGVDAPPSSPSPPLVVPGELLSLATDIDVFSADERGTAGKRLKTLNIWIRNMKPSK
jgi:hypothetical protein